MYTDKDSNLISGTSLNLFVSLCSAAIITATLMKGADLCWDSVKYFEILCDVGTQY